MLMPVGHLLRGRVQPTPLPSTVSCGQIDNPPPLEFGFMVVVPESVLGTIPYFPSQPDRQPIDWQGSVQEKSKQPGDTPSEPKAAFVAVGDEVESQDIT
jgi:hypothetical protein